VKCWYFSHKGPTLAQFHNQNLEQ